MASKKVDDTKYKTKSYFNSFCKSFTSFIAPLFNFIRRYVSLTCLQRAMVKKVSDAFVCSSKVKTLKDHGEEGVTFTLNYICWWKTNRFFMTVLFSYSSFAEMKTSEHRKLYENWMNLYWFWCKTSVIPDQRSINNLYVLN